MKPTLTLTWFEDFQITVALDIAPAEPDVGIFERYVSDWEIVKVDQSKDAAIIKFFTEKLNTVAHSGDWQCALDERINEADDGYDPDAAAEDRREMREMDHDR